MFNKLKLSILGGMLLASFLYSPLGHAQSLTVQGKVLDASGAPLMNGLTEFRVQILTPDGNKCVLFDESHGVDLAASKGLFSVNLGDGTGTVNAGSTYGLEAAISNVVPLSVLPSKCASGAGTYSPAVNDNRKVVIQFTDATMGGVYQVIPEMDLNPVAYAMESRTLNGFPAASVLRVVAGGVPGVAPILSIADATELASLATGSSTKYMARASNGSAQVPAVTSTPTGLAAGSMWFDDSVGGKVLKYYDGTTIQTVGGGGGGAPTGAAGGDLAGTYPDPTLDKIQTVPLTISSLTSGQFLKYNGTAWVNSLLAAADLPTIALNKGGTGLNAPGTADQILGMNAAGSGLEYKTITAGSNITLTPSAGSLTISAAANLAPIASQTLLANPTGSSAIPAATTLSHLLDTSISANQGSLLFRGSTGWTVLPPGTNGYVLKTQGAMADPIWGASSGGGGTVTSVDVASPFMTSSGAIAGAGTITMGYSSQNQGTVLAAPTGASGAPSFRSILKSDLRSTALGNPELFDVAGDCAAGTSLNFNSVSARFECRSYGLTSGQVSGALGYTPVNKAGDAMTGALSLPTNGLTLGTNQLVASSGRVGIGTASPTALLDVAGAMKLSAGAESCGSGAGAGLIHYTSGNLEVCDGMGWKPLASSTAATYTFGLGSAGTAPGWANSGNAYTLNLPTSSAANNGILSASDWSTFNGKSPAAGSASIVNLGTINTGTWHGTPIEPGFGGTGLSSLGASNRVLAMNSGGTAMEYKTLSQGSGITITHNANDIQISAVGGGGTVTGVTATGPLSSSGGSAPVITMNTIAANTLIGNSTVSSAVPTSTTVSNLLDNTAGNTRGSILFRNASGWSAIGPGTSGQFLKTLGAAADPVWDSVSGGSGGTVTQVTSGTGLTGGPITGSGTLSLAGIANLSLLANVSGSTAAPAATTVSGFLDASISSTQGSLLYRNGTGWVALPSGASGQVLKSQGAAANPLWDTDNAGTGTVTGVTATGPLASTGGTAPVISVSPIANNSIFANVSGTPAAPSATTLSSLLDSAATNVQGSILYRNISGWTSLAPGATGEVLKSQGASANPIWGAGGSVSSVNVAAPFMTSSGAVNSSGTITMSYASQAANTALLAPSGSSGSPTFRSILKTDLRSIAGGNPELFDVAGACASGLTLGYDGTSNTFKCLPFSISSSQVSAGLGYTPVNKAGDTMSGALNLPANGLVVGTNQLTVSGGNVGIGTTSPGSVPNWTQNSAQRLLEVAGDGSASTATHGLLVLANNRATPSASDALGALIFSSKGSPYGLSSGIYSTLEGSGGANGFGANLRFYTKSDNTASNYLERMRIDNAGNVGIGSTSPTTKLDVAGSLKIGNGAEACTGGIGGGMIRYLSGNIEVCDGTGWRALTNSAGTSSVVLKDSGSNTVTLRAPATVSASYTVQLPAAAPTTDGQVLSSTIAGVASWVDSASNLNASTAFTSGTLPVTRGGTGVSSLAANGILTANGSGNAISSTTCSTGNMLKWNGSNWACSTDIVGLTAVSATAPLVNGNLWIGDSGGVAQARTISGDATISNMGAVTLATVAVAKGGTGVTSLSANGMVTVNGSGNGLQSTTCSSGQTLVWNGTTWACGTPGGNIQGAISVFATTGSACSTVGQLGSNANGDLLVCDENSSALQGSSCTNVGALTFDAGGNIYACLN